MFCPMSVYYFKIIITLCYCVVLARILRAYARAPKSGRLRINPNAHSSRAPTQLTRRKFDYDTFVTTTIVLHA